MNNEPRPVYTIEQILSTIARLERCLVRYTAAGEPGKRLAEVAEAIESWRDLLATRTN